MKFAIAFVFALMAVIAAGQDCDLQCPQSYTPVCAQAAHGPPQTFGNGCAVNQYICQSATREKTLKIRRN